MGSSGRGRSLAERCFEPVPPWSLAVFRIAFGAILLFETFRFLQNGWVRSHYLDPTFHFRYFGFEWVEPLSEPALNRLLIGIGACCVLMLVGWWTRLAALLFFFGFGYFFLLEQARYLNHFYLVLLFALLLAWVPSDRAWSIAAWFRRRERGEPAARSIPRWALFVVQAQMAIVYGYAAIAKLNGDWLQAQPLKMWLSGREQLGAFGRLLEHDWAPWVASYAGLLLDLLVVPGLLWRRTRALAFASILLFHVLNALIFDIGIFPWLATAATTIFFAPDWPLQWLRRLGGGERVDATAQRPAYVVVAETRSRATLAALVAWLAFQLLFPIRHLLYPGPVSWTEEGHRYSWHMKLRSKSSRATFVVRDPVSGERRLVDPLVELEDWQYRKMSSRPDMILQYAHHLADRFTTVDATGTRRRPEVRARVDCSLNGRPPAPLIDPDVDLAAEPRTLGHARWILPLREPLSSEWATSAFEVEE